jgi:hypothetical protein
LILIDLSAGKRPFPTSLAIQCLQSIDSTRCTFQSIENIQLAARIPALIIKDRRQLRALPQPLHPFVLFSVD